MKQQYDCVWIATDGLVERHPYQRSEVAQTLRHFRANKSWIDGYLVLKYDRGIGVYDRNLHCLRFFIKRHENHL